jgi:hypothetical protein
MNYTIPTLPNAVMSCDAQLAIGVILAIIIYFAMREHSRGYMAAVMLACAASLYTHNFPLMGTFLAITCVFALVARCINGRQPSRS